MHVLSATGNRLARRSARFERAKVRGLGDAATDVSTSVTVNNPEAPQGMIVTYVGTWQTTATLRTDEILTAVGQLLTQAGLAMRSSQVTDSWYTNVLITPQTFQVTMQVQVLGGGFAKLDDIVQVIRHDVYQETGLFPLSDSIPQTQMPGAATVNTGQPSSGTPPPAGGTWSQWLQDNAGIIGIGAAAVLFSVVLVKGR